MAFQFIKNSSQLLPKDLHKTQLNLRKLGLNTLEKALNAVKPDNLIKKAINIHNNQLNINGDIYDLDNFEKIYIIGGGKASADMLFSLEEILLKANYLNYEAIINVPNGLKIDRLYNKSNIQINFASHPIPDENGLKGTKSMITLIEKATNKDLIICLISGGGSALVTLPNERLSLNDKKETNKLLLAVGASIDEINTIRKHLSTIKGGNLAKKIYETSGAKVISLIISDVVGDNLDVIASGPTVPDSTTYKDAYKSLKKYNLIEKVPVNVLNVINSGLKNEYLENPKNNHVCFKNVHNYLIGSVSVAIQEIKSFLEKQNLFVDYFSNAIVGEAKDFGVDLYRIISEKIKSNGNKNLALIGTGELTVTVKGKGIGGRNQEMLLSFLDLTKNKETSYNFLILAANLDGIEGNSKAMGAIADNIIQKRIIKEKISTKTFLDNNDSNSFFKALNCELITGYTGINVNDIILVLINLI